MQYIVEDKEENNENEMKEVNMTERQHTSSEQLSRSSFSRTKDSYEYIDLVSYLKITEFKIITKF